MSTQYFRITAYHPTNNTSIIMDSFGKFEKLWQFSSDIISKGFKVIEVANSDNFLDVNIARSVPDLENYILRAYAAGEPERITHLLNGVTYHAIKIADKIYIPDRNKRV